MKHFLALATLLVAHGFVNAQPNGHQPTHSLEVEVKSIPSYSYDDRYDFNRNTANPNNPSSSPNEGRPLEQSSVFNRLDNNHLTVPQEALERTLSIIKPDGVKNRHIGEIISRFENQGLRVVALKMSKLNKKQASQFYQIHRDRPFFNQLVELMTSGPSVIMVVEGKNAIAKNRQLMGATDPLKAEKGTIRADLAESTTRNAVHGSDSPEAAQKEIRFFFEPQEIYSEG